MSRRTGPSPREVIQRRIDAQGRRQAAAADTQFAAAEKAANDQGLFRHSTNPDDPYARFELSPCPPGCTAHGGGDAA